MTQRLRIPAVLLLLHAVSPSQTQTPTPVAEPPQQAQKLLQYAEQMDADAKRAQAAGQQRAAGAGGGNGHAEQLINNRTTNNNGIYVDVPKVYDDSLLQQMLNSAQSRLVSLQGFDQSGLSKAIGNITGANQQIASFGISGGAQPPVQITSYGNITSPFPPPTGVAPAPTTTLPGSQAPSAADILDEQLQITSQIANLRLLLEGSLSDQIMTGHDDNGHDETFAKPRVTLGFPVVISPEKRYKNAVAIVEVLVETNSQNDASANGEPPSITALLPQEKTYNVAAISDKSASIGAGVATATAGAAANFLWGHKQYFIVKDQDTLALQFQPTDAEINLLSIDRNRVRAFAWQFRPVLGRPYVQAGVRQVFVQLAFPGRSIVPAVKSFGTVRIRTYWRKVNPKNGVLQEVLPASLSESTNVTPIANFDMRQQSGGVASFNPTDMEDLGTGKMLIKLEGKLLPGTYLRVGSNIIQPGAAGLPSDLKTTRFVASIADLATLKTFVISRDGTEVPLKITSPAGPNLFQVNQPTVTTLDDSSVLLSIPISHFEPSTDIPPMILMGGKVFGYADAPIDRKCSADTGTCVLSVALPKDFVAANPVVSVKALMLKEDGRVQSALTPNRTFTLTPPSDVAEKLVLMNHDKDTATYLVYGHDLGQAKIVWPNRGVDPACPPNQLCLQPVAPYSDDPSLRLLKLPIDLAKDTNSVVMQRGARNPYVVAVPAIPPDKDAAASPADSGPKLKERLVVGANEATIVGEKLDSIKNVTFNGKQLNIDDKTPTTLKISGLAKAGASAVAKTGEIVLTNDANKEFKVKLEVVSSKVEVTSK